jgi:hypothetical protein
MIFLQELCFGYQLVLIKIFNIWFVNKLWWDILCCFITVIKFNNGKIKLIKWRNKVFQKVWLIIKLMKYWLVN